MLSLSISFILFHFRHLSYSSVNLANLPPPQAYWGLLVCSFFFLLFVGGRRLIDRQYLSWRGSTGFRGSLDSVVFDSCKWWRRIKGLCSVSGWWLCILNSFSLLQSVIYSTTRAPLLRSGTSQLVAFLVSRVLLFATLFFGGEGG